MTVYAIHRNPFQVAPNVVRFNQGVSLEDMIERVTTLPEGWPRHEHDVIAVNGAVIPRGDWSGVTPQDGDEVGFFAPPMGGGGGDGGKQVLSLVASLAIVAAAGAVTGGTLLGGLTGASGGQATLLSRGLGIGVLVGGNLFISNLSSRPSTPQAASDAGALGTASANGNRLDPNTPLPRVIGTRKVSPPYMAEPLVYYHGQDEVAEVVVALAGPHELTDIRIDGAEIDGMVGVEYETREGWAGFDPLSLVTRYSRTTATQSELRGHVVLEDDATSLDAEAINIDDALPQPKVLGTQTSPDEYWLDLSFTQGLFYTDTPDEILRVPFRLRMRERGSETWINLPEIHFAAAHVGEKRASIRLIWRDGDQAVASAEPQRGWVEARIVSPGQQISPTTQDRTTHPSFNRGSGEDYAISSNLGTTAVQNLILSGTEATLYLDENEIPRGRYEVEIERGYAFRDAVYTASSYTIDGSVRDPFFYEGSSPEIHETKESLSDTVYVARGISVWNERPIQQGGVALIAVKARNASIGNLSALASGYVKDWNGTAWETWTTTSNPAPHYRDILAGQLNALPVPADIIDDDGLVAWRTACDSAGYTVDAILEDLSVDDGLRLTAGAGYAQPYQSEVYGVARDYDRSAEGPVQIFTAHNSANFHFAKGFADLPDGYRITFPDVNEDYEERQVVHPEGAKLTEQVNFSAYVNEQDVRDRADYELESARSRSTFYDFDAPAEAIKCRRWDLIEVNHDLLSREMASGRIVDIEYDEQGNVAGVLMDSDMPVIGGPDWEDIGPDDWDGLDIASIGTAAGVLLRGDSITAHRATIDGPLISLDTPVPVSGLKVDDLAGVGPFGSEAIRMIVYDMKPKSGQPFTWAITAVDEAPEIHHGQ